MGKLAVWQQVAAFVFGVVFVIVILVFAVFFPSPTRFQIFVFRVVLALAAGGVGAILPGFIIVNVGNFVRAGGALALFAAVYLINPPALILDGTKYADLMRRAETALARNDHANALHLYSAAQAENPETWQAYHGIARAHFARGNYAAASENLRIAFDKEGRTDGTLLYGLGLAYDGQGDHAAAEKAYSNALAHLPGDSRIANNTRFSRGLMRLLMWQTNEAPLQSTLYDSALQDFASFQQNRLEPQHWAYYHIACLYAVRSTDPSITAEYRKSLLSDASSKLQSAISALSEYTSQKAQTQRSMLVKLLAHPASWKRKPSYPAACPALAKMWTSSDGSADALFPNSN